MENSYLSPKIKSAATAAPVRGAKIAPRSNAETGEEKKKTQRTLRNGLQASPTVGCGHCSCAACCAARCCTRVWVERCAQSSGGNGKQKKKGGSTRRCDSVGLCAATKPRKATALNRPEKSKP